MIQKTLTSKRILVTGGCGYLGAHFIRSLPKNPTFEGVHIRVLDNMQSRNYHSVMDLPDGGLFEFIEGDIMDRATLRLALRDVDYVVHLAAIVRTPMSFDDPAWLGQVNHWGTANLLEECLEASVEHFIFASSVSVYGPGDAFDETSPCRPIGPYAQSKRNAEMAVIAATERGLNATILRLGTLYGYSCATRYDAFVNRLVYLASTGQSVTVYGTGEQMRPVIHVGDAARALAFCLEPGRRTARQIYNALESNPSVLDIVDILQGLIPGIRVRYTDQDAMLSHFSFSSTIDKILGAGWKPEVPITYGVEDLVRRFVNLNPRMLPIDYSNLNEIN